MDQTAASWRHSKGKTLHCEGIDPGGVQEEVFHLVRAIHPSHDPTSIGQAFALFLQACHGDLPGYQPLSTPYHDEHHVLTVVLCCARLLHGLSLQGRSISALTLDAALIGAIFHDIGYLMTTEEGPGSGAQFTETHISRGIAFVRRHLAANLSPFLLDAVCQVIETTHHRPGAALPEYANDEVQLAAQATATADLIGQMSDREYIERLLFLYLEFKEAGIPLFSDVHELLEKSIAFYKTMQERLCEVLGNLAPALEEHFAHVEGVRCNHYLEAVERNLGYLVQVVACDREQRLSLLRRGGIASRVQARLAEGRAG
ncbi:MAG: HD domain-containing protein [Rhodocyclaceae bacterium]|nr:HD domain-containing protein [Rhodocyclaceae bacterium]